MQISSLRSWFFLVTLVLFPAHFVQAGTVRDLVLKENARIQKNFRPASEHAKRAGRTTWTGGTFIGCMTALTAMATMINGGDQLMLPGVLASGGVAGLVGRIVGSSKGWRFFMKRYYGDSETLRTASEYEILSKVFEATSKSPEDFPQKAYLSLPKQIQKQLWAASGKNRKALNARLSGLLIQWESETSENSLNRERPWTSFVEWLIL